MIRAYTVDGLPKMPGSTTSAATTPNRIARHTS